MDSIIVELDRVQVAGRAEDKDAAACNERHAAGTGIGIDAAAISRRKIGFPKRLAASSAKAFDALVIVYAMEDNDAITEDGRAGVAAAQNIAPQNFRATRRPNLHQALVFRVSITAWAENLWPIASCGCRCLQ